MTGFRVGHGYDVHRLAASRRLVLGGVDVPHPKGLEGHSDADVLVHAIIDALLGAAGLGDIGELFPDTDAVYENISSLALLAKVREMLDANGYAVSNVDATVVAESPKLTKHKNEMEVNVARELRIDAGAVSVKATTEEGLGFTGSRRAISAHAVALIFYRNG